MECEKNREGRDYGSEKEISLPLLLLSSDSDTEQLRLLRSESLTQLDRSLGKLTDQRRDCIWWSNLLSLFLMWRAQRLVFLMSARGITLLQSCTDAEEVAGDLEGILGRFDYYPVHSCQSTNIILSTSKLIPLLADEVRETGSLLLSSAQKSWDVFLFICDFDFHGMAWDLNTVNHFISHVSLLPCGTSGADIQSKWNALLYWFCVLRFVLLDWKMSYSPIISQILHSYKIFFFSLIFFFLCSYVYYEEINELPSELLNSRNFDMIRLNLRSSSWGLHNELSYKYILHMRVVFIDVTKANCSILV